MLVDRRHLKGTAALLPIALLAWSGLLPACEGCGESPPDPDSDGGVVGDAAAVLDAAVDGSLAMQPPVDPAPGQATTAFAFLEQSDPLSSALTDAYDAFVTAPTNETEMQQLFARRKSAMQYFAAHADETAAKILGELNGRSPVDERSWRIGFHLLGMFESTPGISFLFDQAAAAVPADPEPQDSDQSPASVKMRLRRAAVGALGSIAVRGSSNARGKLLDLVGVAGGLDLKSEAMRAFYAASPSRSKAKEQLLAKLRPEERYLVNEVF